MSAPIDGEAYRELVRAHYVGLAQLGYGWRLHVRRQCHDLEQWDKANYNFGWYEGLLASVDAVYREQDELRTEKKSESVDTPEDRQRPELERALARARSARASRA